jgi:hypothetical protein
MAEWISLYLTLFLIALVDVFSPVRVAIILLLLSGTRPILRSSLFILGIALFNVLFGWVLLVVGFHLPELQHPQSETSGWFGIVVGVGLLWVAIRTVSKARVTPSTPSLPKMVQGLLDFVLKGSVLIAFFAGMVMQMVSFKSLLVYLAGLKTIIEAQLALLAAIFTMLLFITVQLSVMIVPTVVCASFPEHAASFMSTMNRLLMTYSTWLIAVIEAGLGFYFLYRGIVAFMT